MRSGGRPSSGNRGRPADDDVTDAAPPWPAAVTMATAEEGLGAADSAGPGAGTRKAGLSGLWTYRT